MDGWLHTEERTVAVGNHSVKRCSGCLSANVLRCSVLERSRCATKKMFLCDFFQGWNESPPSRMTCQIECHKESQNWCQAGKKYDYIYHHAWRSRTWQKKTDKLAAKARKHAHRARVQACSGGGCNCGGWSERCGDAPGYRFRASGDFSIFARQTGGKSHTGGGTLFAAGCEFHAKQSQMMNNAAAMLTQELGDAGLRLFCGL